MEELKGKNLEKNIKKLILVGLDNAGKTSILLSLKGIKNLRKFASVNPTRGSDTATFIAFDAGYNIIDLGGQEAYRNTHLKNFKQHLIGTNKIIYVIDIQDEERVKESLNLYFRIIELMKQLDEAPPIVFCLNKYDPDLKESKKIKKSMKNIIQDVEKGTQGFFIKIFETSIFNHWSLISAYSYGLSQLSSNRELFKNQLKQFAKKTNSDAILLLNENGIILSNFSKSDIS